MKVRKDGIVEDQPITAVSLPLPSGAATSALQLPDGHNVTVDNASIAVTNTNLDAPLSVIDTTLDSILAGQLADGHEVSTGGLLGGVIYDYAALTETATTDTWTFRNAGSPADTGTIVAVVLITYTDSSKGTIDDVERTT
jgi:hypothetical protein